LHVKAAVRWWWSSDVVRPDVQSDGRRSSTSGERSNWWWPYVSSDDPSPTVRRKRGSDCAIPCDWPDDSLTWIWPRLSRLRPAGRARGDLPPPVAPWAVPWTSLFLPAVERAAEVVVGEVAAEAVVVAAERWRS